MLILTRRLDESIIINNDIKVTILGIKGNQIRIGIEAPKDITIHREEIQNKINAANERIIHCLEDDIRSNEKEPQSSDLNIDKK